MKNKFKVLTPVATILTLRPMTFAYAMESSNIDIHDIISRVITPETQLE